MTTRDQVSEFIERDYIRGRVRLTHYPSGDTCLRHPYMIGRQAGEWIGKLKEFRDKHPAANLIFTCNGDLVDDMRSHAVIATPLKIGDLVITQRNTNERWSKYSIVARRIVGDETVPSEACTDQDEVGTFFYLEDGHILYWSSMDDCWNTTDLAGNARISARLAMEGEDLTYAAFSDADMIKSACAHFGSRLDKKIDLDWATIEWLIDWNPKIDRICKVRDDLLQMARIDDSAIDLRGGQRVLNEFGDLITDMMDTIKGRGAGWEFKFREDRKHLEVLSDSLSKRLNSVEQEASGNHPAP